MNIILAVVLFSMFHLAAGQAGNMFPPPSKHAVTLESQLKHLMLIMVIVLVVAFFFMGIISIYVRRCSHRRDIEDFHFEHLSSIRDPPGLDSDVIHTFPMFLYSSVKGLKIGKGGLECAVCISEFEDAETLRLIPAFDRKGNSSGRWGFTRLFPRSHSTGHSSPERFTLRLPEDVRNRLMSTELNRAKSCSVVFSRAMSGRKGFRSLDVDEDPTVGKECMMIGCSLPPLPPKNGVTRGSHVEDSSGSSSVPRRSSKSIRSSFDRFLLGMDIGQHSNQKPIGERSFDRLRPAD
ncbi:Putative RING-H2 finger protein ATL35, partial [Linum perenne]